MKIEIGKVYSSKFNGDFIVLSRNYDKNDSHSYYNIKFLTTGYERSARYDCIASGNIDDPYYPIIAGVGYIGNVINPSKNPHYTRWSHMLSRCYCITDQAYPLYGGLGVRVCKRWHCFENFLHDLPYLPGYEKMMRDTHIKYNLDKDVLQSNLPHSKRIYSPETCMFIPSSENSMQVAIDHANERNRKYFNVYDRGSNGRIFNVEMQINGVTHRIGNFDNEVVAANAANYMREFYGLPALNQPPYIVSLEDTIKQNKRKLIEMVRVVNK